MGAVNIILSLSVSVSLSLLFARSRSHSLGSFLRGTGGGRVFFTSTTTFNLYFGS